jgi:hypothetical protein
MKQPLWDNVWYRWIERDLELKLRVIPRSGRTEYGPVRGGRLVVRVSGAPVDGKANAGLSKFLATSFACSRGSVALITGEHSRDKLVRIASPAVIPPVLRRGLKRFEG